MKKRFPWFFAALLAVLLCGAAALIAGEAISSASARPAACEYIWYCRPPKKDSCQPLPTEKAAFIAQYPVLYAGNAEEKIIYLTFDDDTEDAVMNTLLDILHRHNAPAAFFLNEGFVRGNPETIRRMASEGHLVCNHTDRHIHISRVTSYNEFVAELSGVEEAYHEATGQELHKFFRPPAGRFTEATLRFAQKMGYTTVFWSFSYVDWQTVRQPNADRAAEAILAATHNGEILLLHAESATNLKILDRLLTAWEKMGYTFGSLESIRPATLSPATPLSPAPVRMQPARGGDEP